MKKVTGRARNRDSSGRTRSRDGTSLADLGVGISPAKCEIFHFQLTVLMKKKIAFPSVNDEKCIEF